VVCGRVYVCHHYRAVYLQFLMIPRTLPYNLQLILAHKCPQGADPLDWAEFLVHKLGGEAQGPGECLEDFPLVHTFTPGLYSRQILMPAGAILTSKVHRTEHQYVVSKGSLWVYSGVDGPQYLQAPHSGVTKPGTRRLLVIEFDTIWTTFHPTSLTDVEEIEHEILEPHENPLLPKEVQRVLLEGHSVLRSRECRLQL